MELPSVAGDPASSGDPVITPTTAARATAASPATTTHTPRCLIRSRRGRGSADPGARGRSGAGPRPGRRPRADLPRGPAAGPGHRAALPAPADPADDRRDPDRPGADRRRADPRPGPGAVSRGAGLEERRPGDRKSTR